MPLDAADLENAAGLTGYAESSYYCENPHDDAADIMALRGLWFYINGLRGYETIEADRLALEADYEQHWGRLYNSANAIKLDEFCKRIAALGKRVVEAEGAKKQKLEASEGACEACQA